MEMKKRLKNKWKGYALPYEQRA